MRPCGFSPAAGERSAVHAATRNGNESDAAGSSSSVSTGERASHDDTHWGTLSESDCGCCSESEELRASAASAIVTMPHTCIDPSEVTHVRLGHARLDYRAWWVIGRAVDGVGAVQHAHVKKCRI